jgi:hypothetical protein
MRVAMLVSAFARAISGQVTAGPFEDGMAALERLDFVQAAQWFRKAADQGHASAARTINRRMVVSLVTGRAVGIPPLASN